MSSENEQKLAAYAERIKTFNAENCMAEYRQMELKRKQIEEQLDLVKAAMGTIETRLNDFLLETNQEGTITTMGSVKRTVKSTFYVEDKPVFRDWAMSNGQDALLSISVTQKAMKQFIDDQYQEYLKRQAEAAVGGVTIPPFEAVLPQGIATKQEIKLSITKK